MTIGAAPTPLITEIQAAVCQHFGVRMSELLSPRRARQIARPRQIAMCLAKHLTSRSLGEIGRKFGRDHTTVIYAIRTIEAMSTFDAELRADLNTVIARIGGTVAARGNVGQAR